MILISLISADCSVCVRLCVCSDSYSKGWLPLPAAASVNKGGYWNLGKCGLCKQELPFPALLQSLGCNLLQVDQFLSSVNTIWQETEGGTGRGRELWWRSKSKQQGVIFAASGKTKHLIVVLPFGTHVLNRHIRSYWMSEDHKRTMYTSSTVNQCLE